MATAKQFTEKVVASDKLVAGNFAPAKGASSKDLIMTDHLLDGVLIDHSANSETVASDLAAVDQPLLMAKADIELSASGESAGAVASDADFSYTDHITSDVAEIVSDQPELVAMNTVQHISDSTVQAAETGSGIYWGWIGAGAVAGGVGGYLLALDHGDSGAPAAGGPETLTVIVEHDIAYIDANQNGKFDEGTEVMAVFGAGDNVHFVDNHVTVHFNDAPDAGALDFSGFGADDKVEIDVSGFSHDVWHTSYGLNLFVDIDSASSAGFAIGGNNSHIASTWSRHFPTSGMMDSVHNGDMDNNWGFGTKGGGGPYISVSCVTGKFQPHNYSAYESRFSVEQAGTKLWAPVGVNMVTLADHLPGNLELNQVSFVNYPLIVGIDSVGAWNDVNDNGSRDDSGLSVSGGVDASDRTVVFHVYDLPGNPDNIKVSGFGLDDRILIDLQSLNGPQGDLPNPSVFNHPVATQYTLFASSTSWLWRETGDGFHWAGAALYVSSGGGTVYLGAGATVETTTESAAILHISSLSSGYYNAARPLQQVVDFVNPPLQ